MFTIDLEIYKKYSNDLNNLISHFTDSNQKSFEVMEKLKAFIENNTAIVGGHITNDQLVSFIWCYVREFGGEYRLHISYFIVDEFYRGQGLSKELLFFAKENAKKLNINLIDLNVEPDNDKAIKVYEKSGFTTERLQLVMKVNKGDGLV